MLVIHLSDHFNANGPINSNLLQFHKIDGYKCQT